MQTVINFFKVSGPGTLGTPNPCTTTGGSCSVTLTSSTTGVTVLRATTAVSVGSLVRLLQPARLRDSQAVNAALAFQGVQQGDLLSERQLALQSGIRRGAPEQQAARKWQQM